MKVIECERCSGKEVERKVKYHWKDIIFQIPCFPVHEVLMPSGYSDFIETPFIHLKNGEKLCNIGEVKEFIKKRA